MDYSKLGTEPVSNDSPAGSDCRYEEAFELLQAQIIKMSSPTAHGKVDWAEVVELSASILLDKSKDLAVAGYLAIGLIHTRQIDGLDDGILVLKDLVANFWDTLYPAPTRMRGRIAAISWWLEKTENELLKRDAAPIPAEQAERIQANLKALDRQLAEKMPNPPLLNSLLRKVETIPVQKPKIPQAPPDAKIKDQAVKPAPRSTANATAAAIAPPPAAPETQSIENAQQMRKSIDAAMQTLRKTSHFLIQQDLKNPMAYRYRRMASWARIEMLPPHTNGVTQLPPPAPQVVNTLHDLQEAGNWPALIENAEQKIPQFFFWFDLNFMVARGLAKLGPEYTKAQVALCQECAFFLQRFPGIETLCFDDGRAFAEPQTLKWLATIRLDDNGTPSTPDHSDSSEDNRFNPIVQQALAMGRKKQLVQAVDLLHQQMLVSSSRNDRLRWRLALVQVLLATKKARLAIPHLDKIVSEIDTFTLEQWDPAITLEGLTTVWKGYHALTESEHKRRADKILNRIAQINPAEAVRLLPG